MTWAAFLDAHWVEVRNLVGFALLIALFWVVRGR